MRSVKSMQHACLSSTKSLANKAIVQSFDFCAHIHSLDLSRALVVVYAKHGVGALIPGCVRMRDERKKRMNG